MPLRLRSTYRQSRIIPWIFLRNEEFGEGRRSNPEEEKPIGDGNSFLLWSEDNALHATKVFPSRLFVLVTSDDPSSSSASCDADKGGVWATYMYEQQEAEKLLAFGHQ